MKKFCLGLAVSVCVVGIVSGGIYGQAPARSATPAGGSQPLLRNAADLQQIPAYNTIYCSGFITDRKIQEGLFVLSGNEGGQKNEFTPGDVVYLNHGAGWIVNPNGEYIALRRMADVNPVEVFPGQRKLLQGLGTFYSEVGRVRVNIVNERNAIGQVTQACESIVIGDILVPFDLKPAPPLRASESFDRFAPPTGKANGTIVAAKDYGMILRAGDIGYMDIGAKEGVQVGQYYRVWRPFEGSKTLDLYRRYRNSYPEKLSGMRLNVHLTPEEVRTLPRDVIGEAVVLHVEGRTATILITHALDAIAVGDQVELE
jgi:hypothetical protein